jgi:SAM-dependent methyltransferase
MGDLVTPMAIRVAATLRLADHMAAGATGVDDLARRISAHPDALGRLLGHLTAVGVVARTGPGEYGLTELGRELQDDHPSGNRSWLDLEGVVGRADLAFVRLLDTVRTGRAAYPAMFGRGFWDDLDADPVLSASFDALMGNHPAVSDVLDGYRWGEVSHVLDVGGGNGRLLAALLLAHPHLRGTLVERAGPAEAARSVLAEAGTLDRCTVVAVSFFDPLPGGADVSILSRVLENWDDEHAVAILRRCAAAAAPSGTVLLVEEGALGQDDEDDEPMGASSVHRQGLRRARVGVLPVHQGHTTRGMGGHHGLRGRHVPGASSRSDAQRNDGQILVANGPGRRTVGDEGQ